MEPICIDNDSMQILGIASVPIQNADFGCLFSAEEGLTKGTVFPELYLPFLGGGKR